MAVKSVVNFIQPTILTTEKDINLLTAEKFADISILVVVL